MPGVWFPLQDVDETTVDRKYIHYAGQPHAEYFDLTLPWLAVPGQPLLHSGMKGNTRIRL